MRLRLAFNSIIIVALLLLPYFLFEGKLFIGGDDTRLFYTYPSEYLKNVAFFSWTNLSSFGWNFSYQSFVPFTLVWSILHLLIPDKTILHYFSFSLSFIFGLIFFQKLFHSIIVKKTYGNEGLIGALFYITSPIIINNHFLNPLIPIWLIGLIPAACYYLIEFVKGGRYQNILKSVILVTVFSFGSHNIPWIGGFLIPAVLGLIVSSALFSRRDVITFIKRVSIFLFFLTLSQMFWLYGFLVTIFDTSSSSFTAKVVSESFTSEFRRSIEATARGNIIYPLLNLFPRQIAFDFSWHLKSVYLNFFDKFYFLNFTYIALVVFGILNIKKYLLKQERKVFIVVLVSFILALYLFTVNIGLLFDLYILLGKIPGFVLFRNPYDKFALGYTLIYSLLISYCIVVFNRRFKKTNIRNMLTIVVLAIIGLNTLTIKSIVVSPLWTTSSVYKNITIPDEYLSLMSEIRSKVSSSTNILNVPYGLSLYSFIKDADSNNVYAGVSPLVILSGVNDISGFLSFNYQPQGDELNSAIENRDYERINDILYTHNINYVLVTKNIPQEVKDSYLFIEGVLKSQDAEFLGKVTKNKVFTSTDGNYELYSTNKSNSMLSSESLAYKKISKIKYEMYLNGVRGKQELLFNDSFHKDWKIFIEPIEYKIECSTAIKFKDLKTDECRPGNKMIELEELKYLFRKDFFGETHNVMNGFSNVWTIDSEYIKSNIDARFYEMNEDGSINVNLILYFKPQLNFYIGSIISILVVVFLFLCSIKKYEKK